MIRIGLTRHKLSARLVYAAVVAQALLLSACATPEPVAPWERGYLADESMQWGSHPREDRLRGHVYTSKEASAGGSGAAAGGCGCN